VKYGVSGTEVETANDSVEDNYDLECVGSFYSQLVFLGV
jgi:hypothetical protein